MLAMVVCLRQETLIRERGICTYDVSIQISADGQFDAVR